jgi:hypothetical protein
MDANERLNLEELTLLREMRGNSSVMNALEKVFQSERGRHLNNMANEALCRPVNTENCVAEAANVRKMKEWRVWFDAALDRLAK